MEILKLDKARLNIYEALESISFCASKFVLRCEALIVSDYITSLKMALMGGIITIGLVKAFDMIPRNDGKKLWVQENWLFAFGKMHSGLFTKSFKQVQKITILRTCHNTHIDHNNIEGNCKPSIEP